MPSWPPLIVAANVVACAYVLAAAAWYLGRRYHWYAQCRAVWDYERPPAPVGAWSKRG